MRFFFFFSDLSLVSFFFFSRVHAGVPSTVSQNETMLCQEDFLAAMKDYENDSETEEDGEEID